MTDNVFPWSITDNYTSRNRVTRPPHVHTWRVFVPRSRYAIWMRPKGFSCLVPRSRSPFLVLVPRSGPSFPRSSFLVHRFITPSPPSGKEASHTLGIIYTIISNALVRGMPVLKTRNSFNLISTGRGGTKNPRKIIYHAQGTILGLPGTGVLPVLRAFRNSVTPKKFLQVRWDASPNPHNYTRGTRLRVCPAVLNQTVLRSIRTWVPT